MYLLTTSHSSGTLCSAFSVGNFKNSLHDYFLNIDSVNLLLYKNQYNKNNMRSQSHRHHAPERELLRIYPRAFRWLGGCIALLGIALFLVHLLNINNENFSYMDIAQAIIAIIGGIWLSQTKIVLTTQRISYALPFFVAQIERQLVQDIKIIPDQRTQQLLNQPKWIQKLSARAINKDDDYWLKHGNLWFQHQEKRYSLTGMSLRVLPLNIMSDEHRHDLFQHLQTHWGFAVNQVERVAVSPVSTDFNERDIGKRCLYVLFTGIALFIAMSFAPTFLYSGIHFGVESYIPLVPCALIAIGISYVYIRAERKAYPVIAAVLTGTLMGGAIYFSALQLNRWYSEQHHQERQTTLFLERYDQDVQVWKLPTDLATTLGIDYLYFSPKIEGFDGSLKAQSHYSIILKQGLLHDYFVDATSMQRIQPVKAVE